MSDRIERFLSEHDLWLDEDTRTDLILLCMSFYDQGLSYAKVNHCSECGMEKPDHKMSCDSRGGK
jgi:hypothetical protein